MDKSRRNHCSYGSSGAAAVGLKCPTRKQPQWWGRFDGGVRNSAPRKRPDISGKTRPQTGDRGRGRPQNIQSQRFQRGRQLRKRPAEGHLKAWFGTGLARGNQGHKGKRGRGEGKRGRGEEGRGVRGLRREWRSGGKGETKRGCTGAR